MHSGAEGQPERRRPKTEPSPKARAAFGDHHLRTRARAPRAAFRARDGAVGRGPDRTRPRFGWPGLTGRGPVEKR